MTKTYSNKSNATRAAKAAGLGAANCFQVLDGTWAFRALAVDLGTYHTAHIGAHMEVVLSAPAKPYRIRQGNPARVAARKAQAAATAAALVQPTTKAPAAPKATPAATTGTPPHKQFAVYGRSAVLSPVQFVHEFLNAKGKDLTRKQAIHALSEAGVNYSTARTQYQRWFTANK